MQTELFTFIDFRISLVIQGLENCLALRFDKGRRGACLFTILLRLLKNLEKPESALSPQLHMAKSQLISDNSE